MMVIVFLITISLGGIMLFLSTIFGEESVISTIIVSNYNSYFVNDSQFGGLHTGWNLYLPVANALLSFVLATFWPKKDEKLKGYDVFVAYFAIVALASILNAGVFVRFGFLMATLSFPLIIGYLKELKDKRIRLILIGSVFVLFLLQSTKSFAQIDSSNLIDNVKDKVTTSIFETLRFGGN